MQKITKTNFIQYLSCPREFWMKFNHPAKLPSPTLDEQFRMKQGYEVENAVRRLLTQRGDRPYDFQRFVFDGDLAARIDALAEKPDGSHEIIEVKSIKSIPEDAPGRTKKLEEYMYDLAFQLYVARNSGLNITSVALATLNRDFVLGDELDLEQLIAFEDHTEAVEVLQQDVESLISAAREYLITGPGDDFENLCGDKLKCVYFENFVPGLPHPNIFNLPRITEKRLDPLISQGILAISDIPPDASLTDSQWDWVRFKLSEEKQIDKEAIDEALDLEYPLYFLDYEAANPAIPVIKGMSPYQQITFQYSVHIRNAPGEEPVPFGFLSDGSDEPTRSVAEELSRVIGDTGNVVVWFERFEKERNAEMAALYPEFEAFMTSVNERVFDLYEVFNKGLYKDPGMANNKLKTVLPTLVPELSYSELDIRNGGVASVRWFEDVFRGDDQERKRLTLESLREYCALDTLAMVRIMDYLAAL
ncbi:MAG TPA: DUF2779 domain-containing protein [Aridibacter sp.]|nr:DUF2779 domain-containing protein [Aridibacter sp.]